MELTTYREIEEILLYAIKMPTIKIKSVSEQTGLNLNMLYKWSRGERRIKPDNADRLLIWFRDCRPDILEAAQTLYKKRGVIDEPIK